MDNGIISAIIAAIVTLIGVIVTYLATKQQLKVRLKEIEIKQNQLDIERKKLTSLSDEIKKEMVVLHQNQLHEILKKRIEVYPYLWEIVTVHWQHYDNNKKNKQWCQRFLNELKRCNEQYGVYFSQAVYEQYHMLYRELQRIYIDIAVSNTIIDNEDIDFINTIWYGSDKYGLGLASQLKNDLGSYKIALIQDKKTK